MSPVFDRKQPPMSSKSQQQSFKDESKQVEHKTQCHLPAIYEHRNVIWVGKNHDIDLWPYISSVQLILVLHQNDETMKAYE